MPRFRSFNSGLQTINNFEIYSRIKKIVFILIDEKAALNIEMKKYNY